MSVGDGGYSSGGASLSQAGFDSKLWNYAVDQDYQTPDEPGLNKWRFSNIYPVSRLSMKNIDSMVKSSNRFVKIMDERNRKQVMNNLQSGLSEETNKCKPGYYYCFTDKKCKKIPMGYYVGRGGYLSKDNDDSENKKKNGNGNGNVSNGNGNGNGGNGNGSGSSGSNGGGNGGGGIGEESNPRIPRKKGQPANSKKHSDLYTDENPVGTIHGLGFKDVATAKASVAKIKKSDRKHAHKIQAAVAMEQRAREMGKTSEAAVFRKFINSMKKKTEAMNEEGLRDWFGKSKSKGGKPGWVQVVSGKPCARQPGQKSTPKCVSSAKRASMTDAERKSAQRRKRAADPGQPQKTGAAKPTYVSTDKPKKKMKEEKLMSVSEVRNAYAIGMAAAKKKYNDEPPLEKKTIKKAHEIADAIKEVAPLVAGGAGMAARALAPMAVKQLTRAALIRLMLQGVRRDTPEPQEKQMKKEQKLLSVSEAKDKKGKGSGTKDACYHKVKSRYSVWPSAYASGALVKCRKVGAANWGNKSEEYVGESVPKNVKKIAKELDAAVDMHKSQAKRLRKAGISEDNLDEKCWKGYEKKGMKTMFGKRYPNCVKKTKKEEVELVDERNRLDGPEERKKDLDRRYDPKGGGRNPFQYVPVKQAMAKKAKKEDVDLGDNLTLHVEGMGDVRYCPQCEKNETREECTYGPKNWDMNSRPMGLGANTFDEEYVDEKYIRIQKMGRTYTMFFTFRGQYKSLQFFFPTSKRPSREEVLIQLRKIYPEAVLVNFFERDRIENEPLVTVEGAKSFDQFKNNAIVEGAAWTKKAGKNSEGGLNEKGRKSYERENPGSDLKRPSKKVGNPRRASFCARMKGMKAKLTSAKTARDPNSRINKSLRAWNC